MVKIPSQLKNTLLIKVKRLSKDAILPSSSTLGSSGMDLSLCGESVSIRPGEIRIVETGIVVEIPTGYEGQIRPRSGLAAKNGITVLNSPGTIDSDYRGEVKVV